MSDKFDLEVSATQHTFHNIYEPVPFLPSGTSGRSKVVFGLTSAASAIPEELRTKAFIRPWEKTDRGGRPRFPFPQMGEVDYLLIRGGRRPEVEHVSGWELIDRRLREAAARNMPRDWIFRNHALRLVGSVYLYGEPPFGDQSREYLGITPDMFKLVLEKVTILD